MDFINVKDGESPLYTPDSTQPRYTQQPMPMGQAFGSTFDSDTVDGIEAVTYHAYGPNKLVATGPGSYLPYGIVPPPGGVVTGGGAPIPPPVSSITLVSNDLLAYASLTVGSDGVTSLSSTTGSPAIPLVYLSNSSTTYWITFSRSDTVLIVQPSHFTGSALSASLLDPSMNVWLVTIDSDGVIRTTNMGSI